METFYYNLSGGINQASTKTELGLNTQRQAEKSTFTTIKATVLQKLKEHLNLNRLYSQTF